MAGQCSCGFPTTRGMVHRLGQPCLLQDSVAMMDRGSGPVTTPTLVPKEFALSERAEGELLAAMTGSEAPEAARNLLAGMDLRAIDPQYLDVTQKEIVARAQEMAEGYERRIANMAKVIQNLSASRDKLVQLRAKVDTVINEVDAVAAKSTSDTAKQNFRIITAFLRSAADAAAD